MDDNGQPSTGFRSKIITIPKELLTTQQLQDIDGDGIKTSRRLISVVKIRHPRTRAGDMFLFDGSHGNVYQLMNFKEKHGSWFLGDTVQKDGSMVFATPIDPIFLVLPYLTQSTKFRPLDQVIVDAEFPECERLLSCKALEKIENVAEFKEYGRLKAYRYDGSKCMTWLAAKVRAATAVLRSKGVDVSTGARAATFVANNRENSAANQDDYVRYAHGLVSEYLPEDISQTLLEHLGIAKESLVTEIPTQPPPAKRCKLEGTGGPIEDYSKGTDKLKLAHKQVPKLTTTQKALSKVDKSGMKSISSFFSKRR